jgi:hypothetical protein
VVVERERSKRPGRPPFEATVGWLLRDPRRPFDRRRTDRVDPNRHGNKESSAA